MYCAVTGRPTEEEDSPWSLTEREHAEFDDGKGDDKWDEWKLDASVMPEQDKTVVYEVIKAAKNGNMAAFKNHFDTEIVVPDDDEVAQVRLREAFTTFITLAGLMPECACSVEYGLFFSFATTIQ